ncbi:MAG: O-antigen ligase family protein [Anaerolineae bacterium]|nr:O-antigen ligase family protein [Anaerolineae bacterium]
MSFLTRSIGFAQTYGSGFFSKIKNILIVFSVVGLGVVFGYLMNQSQETAWLVTSLTLLLALILITNYKPLFGFILIIPFYSFLEPYIEINMGAGLPDLSFSRFMVVFLAIFMLAQGAIKKFEIKRISIVEFCAAGILIGIGSSAAGASDAIRMFQVLLSRFVVPLSLYFFARNLIQSKQDLNKFLWGISLLGLAGSIYAIYEIYTGNILFAGLDFDAEAARTTYSGSLTLLNGLFGRSPVFGRIFAMTIPISFYLLFDSKDKRAKTLLTLALMVQFYGLFLTYNRTSWYAAIIGLTILQLFYAQFRLAYIVIVLVAALSLWAMWDQLQKTDVVEDRVNRNSETFNGRTEMWEAAREMWKVKPIRGWGEGAFEKESARFRPDGRNVNFRSTQSEYWDILVHYGLIGFVPYFLFLFIPLLYSVVLFFLSRSAGWSGFINPGIISIYWTVLIVFLLGGYTVPVNNPIGRMIPFAVAGAIVGTHQDLARNTLLALFKINPFRKKPVTQ